MSYTYTSETVGRRILNLYKHRLNNVRLTWCQQVLNILKNFSIGTINDLGCNYFQLYKEIKIRNLKYNYFGYDIDENFVNLGLKKFPELKKKYKIKNLENVKLRKTDCSICSAVLTHVDKPYKVLKNIFFSTKKIIILRTFFDLKKSNTIQRKSVLKPCNVNQFPFKKISNLFKKNGFDTYFVLDEATNYSRKFLKVDSIKNKRFMYILVGIKSSKKN